MSYRPSRTFVIIMAVSLTLGGGGAWAWHQANAVPMSMRAKMSFLEALRYQAPPVPKRWTQAELAEFRTQARALQEKLVSEFPALRVTPVPVPAEENGFLLLYQLSPAPLYNNLSLGTELREILDERVPWNPENAKRCLDEQADLVHQIERIAQLPTRSSSDMPADFTGFIAARASKTCADLLLLKARLAAERGDEEETLRLVAATGNLAAHHHAIESPTLLGETVAILIDRGIKGAAFKTLLPAIGCKADLPRWQAALGTRRYDGTGLAQVMRGEWNIASEFMLLPVLFANQTPDAEAVARVYAAWYHAVVLKLPTLKLAELAPFSFPPPDDSQLSKQGRKIIGDFSIGLSAWSKGYVGSASHQRQAQAALALLALEKSGSTLAAESAAQIPREPVSGAPFVFDPVTRTLAMPENSDLAPLKLPW